MEEMFTFSEEDHVDLELYEMILIYRELKLQLSDIEQELYNTLITNLIATAKDMAQTQHISICEAIDRSATLFDERGYYISNEDFLNLMADFRNL